MGKKKAPAIKKGGKEKKQKEEEEIDILETLMEDYEKFQDIP